MALYFIRLSSHITREIRSVYNFLRPTIKTPPSLHCPSLSHCIQIHVHHSHQFSSVTQSCLIFCSPMDCSMPGFPVHHRLLEPTQTHAHPVGDAIQPAYSLSSSSPPAFSLSQYQSLFQWVSSSHQVAKVLELQLQYESFQWIFRTDFL